MNECLEALKNVDSEDSQDIIDWALPGINHATNICVAAAKEPYEKCVKTLKILQELQQAVLALRDSKNCRAEKNKEELVEQLRIKEQKEDELNELKKQLEMQQQNAENARKNYTETLKNNNEVSLTVFTMIMDNLNTFCRTAGEVALNSMLKFQKLQNHEPLMTKEDLIKIFSEDDVLAQATEKTLFKIIEEIVEKKDEEIHANIQEHISNLKCATDYKTNEKAGKILREKGNDLRDALIKVRENGATCQEDLKTAKASAKLFLKTYEEAVEIKNKTKEDEKELQAEMSRERQNLMQTRADNLKVVQGTLDSEKIDLNEILECLEEVIQVLTTIQIAYSEIVHYFNYVKELIDGPLITQIQDISKFIVNEDQTVKSLTDRQQRILLTEIIKACSLSYILMQNSKFYNELSNKHIMPTLDNALRINAMTKEEAKIHKNEIPTNLVKVKYEVSGAIDSQNTFIRNHVYSLLKKQGFDVGRTIE
uniref:Uncharacterized protein n=1 Tax=Panagrolaimus davidi TaxID=227884 RepID=A0A914Q6M1_9BILA